MFPFFQDMCRGGSDRSVEFSVAIDVTDFVLGDNVHTSESDCYQKKNDISRRRKMRFKHSDLMQTQCHDTYGWYASSRNGKEDSSLSCFASFEHIIDFPEKEKPYKKGDTYRPEDFQKCRIIFSIEPHYAREENIYSQRRVYSRTQRHEIVLFWRSGNIIVHIDFYKLLRTRNIAGNTQ